jgi:hypothetical protein
MIMGVGATGPVIMRVRVTGFGIMLVAVDVIDAASFVITMRAWGGRVVVLVPHRSSMDRKSGCSTSTSASGMRLQTLRSWAGAGAEHNPGPAAPAPGHTCRPRGRYHGSFWIKIW